MQGLGGTSLEAQAEEAVGAVQAEGAHEHADPTVCSEPQQRKEGEAVTAALQCDH